MTTLTEDDVLEQLDAQDNLFSFMKTAHTILLQGIRQFLPSLFVDNDEEIVEYAVKPLLAQSGPLDDIDVALRLIYALGMVLGARELICASGRFAAGLTLDITVKLLMQDERFGSFECAISANEETLATGRVNTFQPSAEELTSLFNQGSNA